MPVSPTPACARPPQRGAPSIRPVPLTSRAGASSPAALLPKVVDVSRRLGALPAVLELALVLRLGPAPSSGTGADAGAGTSLGPPAAGEAAAVGEGGGSRRPPTLGAMLEAVARSKACIWRQVNAGWGRYG